MMISGPWYLVAAGIALLLLGYFGAALFGVGDSSSTAIHERMSDDEIARRLEKQSARTVWDYLVLAGYLCLLVSVIWRLARKVM